MYLAGVNTFKNLLTFKIYLFKAYTIISFNFRTINFLRTKIIKKYKR